ncbi:MAG TPA: DUF4258 domain-containing protein [Propionicimonas sp.]|jgi:hypothetical protein
MQPVEALEAVKGYAGANRIYIGDHARERMEERGATERDIREALMTASACGLQTNGRWKVTGGRDLDGTELELVVVIEDGLVVMTLF